MVDSNHIPGVFDGPAGLLLVELVELISAVVLVGFALEPPRHVLADFPAWGRRYEGCAIISLRYRRTSVFWGMDLRAEKRGGWSSGLAGRMVEKLGFGWWVMMFEGRVFWVLSWLLK
jgi:hypothetical protein